MFLNMKKYLVKISTFPISLAAMHNHVYMGMN